MIKDKDMRPILIEWIKTQHETVRIYEEKSIGTSICDVMAVTDTLSGYEIKSDVDDLRRLGGQAYQYERVFLYCWPVVGETIPICCEWYLKFAPNHDTIISWIFMSIRDVKF